MSDIRKIVINACFGGFGLSDEAVMLYAQKKGMTVFPEKDEKYGFVTYWTVPESERPTPIADWRNAPLEKRKAYNEAYDKKTLSPRDIPRDDSVLVEVVETLGKNASDWCARLEVVEIPADAQWEIMEYDGNEHVAEAHRTWS